jgi:hypothetical protein
MTGGHGRMSRTAQKILNLSPLADHRAYTQADRSPPSVVETKDRRRDSTSSAGT